MRNRGLCCRPVSVCPSVCLSVRLSRWWIVSTGLKISANFFLGPVSPSFYFFDSERWYPFPRGTPSAGAQNTRGWKNSAIFVRNRRLSRKRYEIDPWLLWNVNRKSYALYQMMTFSMSLTDPNPVFKVTAFWSRISQKLCVFETKLGPTIEH